MPFEKPPEVSVLKRMVIVPWGKEKMGKTAFALSFPGPIRFLDFNYGTEGLSRHWNGKDIEFARYKLTPMSDTKDVESAVARFQDEYMESLHYCNQRAGTVIVDTGSELYDNVQIAKLAEVKRRKNPKDPDRVDVLAWDYAASNALMNSVYLAPLQMDAVNVVIIHKCKELWIDSQPSGRFAIDGWKGTSGAVQMTAECMKKLEGGKQKYEMRINTCRLDPSLEGQTLAASYDFLAANLGLER